MAKTNSIDIDINLNISDESAAKCVDFLNIWLKDKNNRVVVKENEDRTLEIEII